MLKRPITRIVIPHRIPAGARTTVVSFDSYAPGAGNAGSVDEEGSVEEEGSVVKGSVVEGSVVEGSVVEEGNVGNGAVSETCAAFSPDTWKASRGTALAALTGALACASQGGGDGAAAAVCANAAEAAAAAPPAAAAGEPRVPTHVVVADDTMHLRSMRLHLLRLAYSYGATCLILHVTTPLDQEVEGSTDTGVPVVTVAVGGCAADTVGAGEGQGREQGEEREGGDVAAAADSVVLCSSRRGAWEAGRCVAVDLGGVALKEVEGVSARALEALFSLWRRSLPTAITHAAHSSGTTSTSTSTSTTRSSATNASSSAVHAFDLRLRKILSHASRQSPGSAGESRSPVCESRDTCAVWPRDLLIAPHHPSHAAPPRDLLVTPTTPSTLGFHVPPSPPFVRVSVFPIQFHSVPLPFRFFRSPCPGESGDECDECDGCDACDGSMASEEGHTVYLGGLPFDSDEGAIKKVFEEFGEVLSAKVIYDRETGKARGFGFVTFASPKAAQDAIKAMDGEIVDGRPIKVSEVRRRGDGGFFRQSSFERDRDRPRGVARRPSMSPPRRSRSPPSRVRWGESLEALRAAVERARREKQSVAAQMQQLEQALQRATATEVSLKERIKYIPTASTTPDTRTIISTYVTPYSPTMPPLVMLETWSPHCNHEQVLEAAKKQVAAGYEEKLALHSKVGALKKLERSWVRGGNRGRRFDGERKDGSAQQVGHVLISRG
ncbi:unnamed protein product [Closterium sp. Yama58-4]|nr:unnamed protein product [Closterium sp. Yama58-4]